MVWLQVFNTAMLVAVIGLIIKRMPRHFSAVSTDTPRVRVTPNHGPYSKPSGKRTPKVNDDSAAWRKENDA